MNSRSQAKYSIIAVFVGLSVGSLFFLPFNVNPLEAYRTMFQTAFLDTQCL